MATIEVGFDASFSVDCELALRTRTTYERSETELRALQTISVQPEKTPTLYGNGVMPALWIRTTPVFSSQGEYIDSGRPEQGASGIVASAQWIPFEELWDVTTGTWMPWRSEQEGWSWTSDLLTQPTFEDVTYRVGKEIITVRGMRIAGSQHFTSDFNQDDAVAWTISMVVMLEVPQAAPYALLDWGIPGYVDQEVPLARPYLHAGENLHFGWGGSQGMVDPISPLSRYRPAFITLTVAPPLARATFSNGGSFSFSGDTGQSENELATPMQFWLGRSTDPELEEGDFTLLELNIWNRALTPKEIVTLNGMYASVYGATNES